MMKEEGMRECGEGGMRKKGGKTWKGTGCKGTLTYPPGGEKKSLNIQISYNPYITYINISNKRGTIF